MQLHYTASVQDVDSPSPPVQPALKKKKTNQKPNREKVQDPLSNLEMSRFPVGS